MKSYRKTKKLSVWKIALVLVIMYSVLGLCLSIATMFYTVN
jgi:hypothetical protein